MTTTQMFIKRTDDYKKYSTKQLISIMLCDMKYTVDVEIPDIERLEKEIKRLTDIISAIDGKTAGYQEVYTVADLSRMTGVPYSTLRAHPELWPDNPLRRDGSRRTVFGREDVDSWLATKAKGLGVGNRIY